MPGPGVLDTFYLEQGHWLFSGSFRFYNSTADVLGNRPLTVPIIFANTHVYEWDFSATYAVTDRFDLTLSGPISYGNRRTEEGTYPGGPKYHSMSAWGPGNIRLDGDFYIVNPPKSPDRNFAVSVGVEFPVGIDDATDTALRPYGKIQRPVDPAIQPADGGWGIALGGHGYSSLYFPMWPATRSLRNTILYTDGVYLATPQEHNHTQFVDADLGVPPSVFYDEIPDSFLVRLGVSQLLLPSIGLSGSVGLRFEGVPKWSLIGHSSGFSIPGNSLSFDPALTVTRGRHSFSVSLPIAVHRYGSNSLGGERAGGSGAGFATIADWQLIVGYSVEF